MVPPIAIVAAAILDFRGSIWQSLQRMPGNSLVAAAILDFRAKLGNRCKLFPVYTLFRASILDFRAKLGNRCSAIAATVRNGPPAVCRGGRRRGQDATKAA